MSTGRTIVIGDVHGCARELRTLVEKLSPNPIDDIIFLGDMINKGPESHEVLNIIREIHGRGILGNHELRLLKYRQTSDPSILKAYDPFTISQLTEPDWFLLDQLPLTIEIPEYDAIAVHGGFLPTPHWRQQAADIVTKIQVIDANGNPVKRSEAPDGIPWADAWEGPEFVLYGHTPREEVYRKPLSLGLDTGCVYGGALSAFIFPQRTLIQIPAERIYHKRS